MSSYMAQKTMRSTGLSNNVEVRTVYILVMGLTGAGKSTFISVATGDEDIAVGHDGTMDGVTQEVADYVLYHWKGGILHEIHLIDSPGFDDDTLDDSGVLSRIAQYVNINYKLKQPLAGVLYLHDITKQRMGGVGERNLRMLEKMIGIDKWDNCTLITTKWGCTNNPKGEEEREKTLQNSEKYFRAMLQNAHQANMARFDPKSRGRALEIIKPLLGNKFSPRISDQMVDPQGPKLALGDTDAGKVVADNIEKLLKANGLVEELQASRQILAQKFNTKVFEEFKGRRDKLVHQQHLNRAGRWAIRTAIVGGTIAATIATMGPGATLIALEPPFEKFARHQKLGERQAMGQLEQEYKENSAETQAMGGYDSAWLRDKKVQRIQDLESEGYSLKSQSSTELSVVEEKETDRNGKA